MSFYRLKKDLTASGGILALVFLGFPLIQNAVELRLSSYRCFFSSGGPGVFFQYRASGTRFSRDFRFGAGCPLRVIQ